MGFTQGVAKADCLDKLASDRGLSSVQPLTEAYLAHCTACTTKMRAVPNDFDC